MKSEISLEWEDEETLYVKNIEVSNQEDRSIMLDVKKLDGNGKGMDCF